MKHLLLFALAVLFAACSASNQKFYDEGNKTIFINGVSASNGKTAVIESLQAAGFEMFATDTIDETIIGGHLNYCNHFSIENPSAELTNLLSYGLFSEYQLKPEKVIVTLSYFPDGTISEYFFNMVDFDIYDEKIIMDINKKIASLFEKSKIGNSRSGYKTYYNESNNVSLYYPNSCHFQINLN